jgi:putative membrane protein
VFETLAQRSFTGHMVQHLLVIVIAAPLLVVGQPGRLWRAVRPPSRHSPPTRRIGAAWRRYGVVVAPFGFVVVLYVTHLTSIYDDALHDRWLHEAEHAAYLLSAVGLWAVVLGAGRRAATARVAAGFVVTAGGALLGVILLSASEPLMPTYAARLGTADALSDQRTAAALMWTAGMLTTLPMIVVALWRWAAREDRLVRQAEAMLDATSRG